MFDMNDTYELHVKRHANGTCSVGWSCLLCDADDMSGHMSDNEEWEKRMLSRSARAHVRSCHKEQLNPE